MSDLKSQTQVYMGTAALSYFSANSLLIINSNLINFMAHTSSHPFYATFCIRESKLRIIGPRCYLWNDPREGPAEFLTLLLFCENTFFAVQITHLSAKPLINLFAK